MFISCPSLELLPLISDYSPTSVLTCSKSDKLHNRNINRIYKNIKTIEISSETRIFLLLLIF